MPSTFSYTEVPFNYAHCTGKGCPQASNCLRHLALQNVPATKQSINMINPNWIATQKMPCELFRSAKKLRYAKGFMTTVKALTMGVSDNFRWRMIGYYGKKKYYDKRKGALLCDPGEQAMIIKLAKQLGVELTDYFDEYIEDYNW